MFPNVPKPCSEKYTDARKQQLAELTPAREQCIVHKCLTAVVSCDNHENHDSSKIKPGTLAVVTASGPATTTSVSEDTDPAT